MKDASDERRRVWPWILLALLLLGAAFVLLLVLAPGAPAPDGKGVPYPLRDRLLILFTGESGWLLFTMASRALLAVRRVGLLFKVARLARGVILAGGLAAAGIGGWLTWSFLSASVHGTSSGSGHSHHSWD